MRARLAEIAWKHNAPPHRMLADRIMTDILDDPQAREEMCQTFGTEIIKKFYKKRGELRIVKQEH